MIDFKVKRLAANAQLPSRKHADDAGIDIYTNESYELQPGETHAFTTGIATEFPAGFVALIWDRSSLGAKGLHCFGGVIDAGFRGEWKIVLHNASRKTQPIKTGDRIAQCLIQSVAAAEPREVNEANNLSTTARGAGAFASTGR